MALNTRGTLDPRFPFAARGVVHGAMLAWGVLYSVRPHSGLTVDWNPWATLPQDRQPTASANYVPVYEGPCRVQPNKDWRARKQNWRDEVISEHATRIQISFEDNILKVPGVQFPDIRINDMFRVTRVFELNGYSVDPQVKNFAHIVRNVSGSSNGWARDLLCDTDVNRQSDPNG